MRINRSNKRNVIIYVGGFILPDGNAAAQRVLANAKILDNLEYEVVFIGVSPNENYNDILLSKKSLGKFTYYQEQYPEKWTQWFLYLISLKSIRIITNELGLYNVVAIIAYNYPAISLFRLRLFCLKHEIKLVADCTEWAISEYSLRGCFKNIDTIIRMRCIHPTLDGLIVISKFLYKYYSAKNNNILLVPPLIDINEKKWFHNAIINSDVVNVVYAGSPGMGLKDRLDIVVNAFISIRTRMKRPYKLIIIGLTKEQFVRDFRSKMNSANSDDIIEFRGRLTHLEAIGIIKDAHYSVFLRDSNIINEAGFPTKFVESVSAGTPVITNSTSNLKDYFENNSIGYIVDIEPFDKLCRSLISLLSKPLSELMENKQTCLESGIFDISIYTDAFKSFFFKLLDENN